MPMYRRKTTRKRTLTKAQRLAREKRIIKDLKAGKLSYRKIAAKHRVSLPTVNAKARKAGIRRSRRGPVALKATHTRTTTRRTKARTTGRVRARTARPRATIRRRKVVRARRKTAARKKTTRKTTTRRTTWIGHSSAKFNEQFRWLVMNYYPNMPLKKFERLSKMIAKAVS